MARWRRVQRDGAFYKWEEEGQTLLGAFEGLDENGDYGPAGQIRTGKGLVRFSCPTILHGLLQKVERGDVVRIAYLGQNTPTKRGQLLKDFTVDVLEEGDLDDEAELPFAQAADDGHPVSDAGPERTETEREGAMAEDTPF